MLNLRVSTEDWREQLANDIDDAEAEYGVRLELAAYNDAAEQLRRDTLHWLDSTGVEYCEAHEQRRGAFAIVQDGSEEEREAFADAMNKARDHARGIVLTIAKEASESVTPADID